mmetsp:Transcript_54214/g.115192  ORF Transcript_54214/g.115192 Transcript_54214/m.115192 type:complete len:82 (-) Transcript_54214:8-253(-)
MAARTRKNAKVARVRGDVDTAHRHFEHKERGSYMLFSIVRSYDNDVTERSSHPGSEHDVGYGNEVATMARLSRACCSSSIV